MNDKLKQENVRRAEGNNKEMESVLEKYMDMLQPEETGVFSAIGKDGYAVIAHLPYRTKSEEHEEERREAFLKNATDGKENVPLALLSLKLSLDADPDLDQAMRAWVKPDIYAVTQSILGPMSFLGNFAKDELPDEGTLNKHREAFLKHLADSKHGSPQAIERAESIFNAMYKHPFLMTCVVVGFASSYAQLGDFTGPPISRFLVMPKKEDNSAVAEAIVSKGSAMGKAGLDLLDYIFDYESFQENLKDEIEELKGLMKGGNSG